ncbi:Hypothetical_protein [Hexamita inflata]|uniref:Hypothetical_protein n=1 Tax=Hexamita inflata TaxID=28002 RepID=A0AA86PRF8_9EUKA|nr:Hypothetical protein HINF_LOCUS31138 [Hexamita inflata]
MCNFSAKTRKTQEKTAKNRGSAETAAACGAAENRVPKTAETACFGTAQQQTIKVKITKPNEQLHQKSMKGTTTTNIISSMCYKQAITTNTCIIFQLKLLINQILNSTEFLSSIVLQQVSDIFKLPVTLRQELQTDVINDVKIQEIIMHRKSYKLCVYFYVLTKFCIILKLLIESEIQHILFIVMTLIQRLMPIQYHK